VQLKEQDWWIFPCYPT